MKTEVTTKDVPPAKNSRWLIDHGASWGKVDGQPKRILLILYEQKKSRMHMKIKSSDEVSFWI